MFVNRKKELAKLEERYKSPRSELLIIYGRRRVGKTELIRHFVKGKPHVYYMSDMRSELEQLKILSDLLSEQFDDIILKSNPIQNWELIFRYITTKLRGRKKFILALDEFQYLAENNSALTSVLQKSWDELLRKKNIMIILCGSSMSFMEKRVLSYKSPLYGRRTGQLEIFQFDFFNLPEMLPQKSTQEHVEFYGVFGGVPAYLELVDQNKSLWKNIEEQVFPSDRLLYNEVMFLLMQELRTPKNYFSILRAIALNKTKLNEIVQHTELERGLAGKFIDNLIQLRIVERKVPVTENPLKSRRGIYVITDNYFRFWFRFIYPYLTYIEEGRTKFVLDKIKSDLSTFLGGVFENICKQYLLSHPELAPFEFSKLGSYWDKDSEIDIAVTDEKQKLYLIGECKYSNKKVGTDILDDTISKSKFIPGNVKQFSYILFSKSGFTEDLIKRAKAENIQLVDLDFEPYFKI